MVKQKWPQLPEGGKKKKPNGVAPTTVEFGLKLLV